MKEFFYEFNIHSPSQFQRYGVAFSNANSNQFKDVTFALKVVRKLADQSSQSPADAAPTPEEAGLFSLMESTNSDLGHFITESKFQNFRQQGYIKSKYLTNHSIYNIMIIILAHNMNTAIKKSGNQSFWITIFEIVLMIGLGVFQVYYLKRVLDNKRMI